MTVLISVGRRVPKKWFKRQANRIGGLITFQENIWQIIKQSLQMAKKKANASGKCKFVIERHRESEDINYEIEWMKVVIRASPELEEEEYQESLKLYDPMNKYFKKELPSDKNLQKHFKTQFLSGAKVDEAYEKGYGSMSEDNISNKLLEMGILTHIEKINDYENRDDEFITDF